MVGIEWKKTCKGAGLEIRLGVITLHPFHIKHPPFHAHIPPALVLRCLQAVQLLIPDIQRHFQWRLPPKQHVLLIHFEQVSEVCACFRYSRLLAMNVHLCMHMALH